MQKKYRNYFLTPILLAGLAVSWQADAETINFEGFAEGAIVSVVVGDGGSGPILVDGFNPMLGGNTAIIFDSSCPPGILTDCSGEDEDLGTPNEDFGGPGIGAGGESGAPFENNMAQGNVLIIAEDLVDVVVPFGFVDDPDDANENGASLNFDFSALGAVTIESIIIIDVEEAENAAEVSFFNVFDVQIGGPFDLPKVGNNGLEVVDLGSVPGVVRMEVGLNGSGAIDNIVFTAGEGCTPGYWKQTQHFESWIDFFPSDPFTDPGFENAYPGKDLLKVLKNGGNRFGLAALGRHTVAALLNALSPDVDYGLTDTEVIDAFNAVFPGSKDDYITLKNQFASLNESACPLN